MFQVLVKVLGMRRGTTRLGFQERTDGAHVQQRVNPCDVTVMRAPKRGEAWRGRKRRKGVQMRVLFLKTGLFRGVCDKVVWRH